MGITRRYPPPPLPIKVCLEDFHEVISNASCTGTPLHICHTGSHAQHSPDGFKLLLEMVRKYVRSQRSRAMKKRKKKEEEEKKKKKKKNGKTWKQKRETGEGGRESESLME